MKRSLLAVLALLLTPPSVSAQSLFATRGLGVPVDPLDGRATALGGIGVGLLGLNPSLVNPAEIWSARRGVTAVLQPSWYSVDTGTTADRVSATRFPMFGVIYPVRPQLTVGLGYAGFLEQSWAVQVDDSVVVEGAPVPIQDVLQSTGGLGQIRLAAAYALSPALTLGMSGGVLTGNVDRTATRTFVDDTTGTLRGFSTEARWEYSGWIGGLGARWDPVPALRLGVSAMLTTALAADSADGDATSQTHQPGFQLAAGASGQITGALVLALGAARSRYPGIKSGPDMDRDTWTVGGGLEYEGLSRGVRTYPVRLGLRLRQLPYYGQGETAAREVATTFGIGFRLAGDESGPLAVIDLGIERARRTGLGSPTLINGLEDRVWRCTFSLALFGR